MNKIIVIALLLSAYLFVGSVHADEVIGTLTTGLSTSTMQGVVVVSPTANPVVGTYASTQNVVLTASGATSIRYTTDDSTPNCLTPTTYHVAIPVSQGLTIKAISCYPNGISSVVASFGYIINPPTPTPTPTPENNGGGGGGGGGGGYFSSTPTPTPQVLGVSAAKCDTNTDGKVDVLDFNTLMTNWGKTGTGVSGDINSDGKVDILDFNFLMANWSK